MSGEINTDHGLKIGHVLFIDIVGYSKLPIEEQREAVEQLSQIVRQAEQFCAAEQSGQLISLPAGDGMALVFSSSVEAPVDCALQIARKLKSHPELPVRMGIHSGPVSGVTDVNERSNVAGAGINTAQRVMERGDAGHILLSKRVADDLEQYRHWRLHLHDLGECEVKHGKKLSIVNFYTDEIGNAEMPAKLRHEREDKSAFDAKPIGRIRTFIGALVIVVVAAVGGYYSLSRWSGSKAPPIASPVIVEKSIAVLPFENLSANPENAFFADGVQDEILTDLAKIADLKVISRTSVMQYKTGVKRNLREIAQALGVAHIVEGSVQRTANRVRVSAQLIDATTDIHLWAEHYDRPLDDVFAIQSEVAKAVADQLRAKLSPAEKAAIEERPTSDLAAYDRYVRAKSLLAVSSVGREGEYLYQAVRLLEQATARDPMFLLAYCKLAFAHQELYFAGFDHTPRRLALANEALKKAFELGPNRGESHLAAVWVYYHCYFDYDRARSELAIARKALPNEPEVFALAGYIDRRQGRWEEHIRNLERAAQADPRNVGVLQNLAQGYEFLRQFSAMSAVLDRTLAVTPIDPVIRARRASVDLQWHADTSPLHATIHDILAEDPGAAASVADQWLELALCERDPAEIQSALASIPPEGITPTTIRLCRPFYEGLAARATEDTTSARVAFMTARAEMEKIVQEQPDYPQALCLLGVIDAGLGRKEDALREARKAVELVPPEKDPLARAELIKYLAVVYAWTGEKEAAFQQLEIVLRIPSPISYGQLRLHPYWDPLRNDPRFEKFVVESAKPVGTK